MPGVGKIGAALNSVAQKVGVGANLIKPSIHKVPMLDCSDTVQLLSNMPKTKCLKFGMNINNVLSALSPVTLATTPWKNIKSLIASNNFSDFRKGVEVFLTGKKVSATAPEATLYGIRRAAEKAAGKV